MKFYRLGKHQKQKYRVPEIMRHRKLRNHFE